MKNFTTIIALAVLMIGFAAQVNAQATVTATATATATIVTPLTISKTVDMSFGNIATNGIAGSVAMAATAGAPTRTPSGGVTLPVMNGTVTAAEFLVSGENSYTYSITLPTGNHEIQTAGNAAQMQVSDFISSPSPTGALSASGTQTIYVGAKLNLATGQAAGTYTSPTGFDVTVNYN